MDTPDSADTHCEREAAKSWRTLEPFHALSDTAWAQVSAKLQTQTVTEGEVILRAGDTALQAFILLRGYAEVAVGDTERVVSKVTEGVLFGELDLLTGGVCSATVIALAPVELLVIPTAVMDIIVQERPEWLAGLAKRTAQQAEALLAADDSLQKLFEQEGKSALESRTFQAGATIVAHGEPSDGVYLINTGQGEIFSATGHVIDRVGPGSCIGELGVMLQVPRSATVVAKTRTTAYWLKGKTFRNRLQENPIADQLLRKLWYGYRFEQSFVRQFSTRNAEGGRRWTVYGMVDGRTVAVCRSRTRNGFHAEVTSGLLAAGLRTLHWGGTPTVPWISITLFNSEDGVRIRCVRATIDRPECSAAFHLLLEDTIVTPDMEERFCRLGQLTRERVSTDSVFCRCLDISRSSVEEAIKEGLTNVEQVETATGCGSVCGGCRIRVSLLLSQTPADDMNRSETSQIPGMEIHVPLISRWAAKFGRATAVSVGLLRYVGPGIATLSILFLPFLALVAPTVAMGFALISAMIILSDLVAARRQWNEIFKEMLAPPVGIAPQEMRPAGFAEDGAQAVRAVVMRRLPFRDWVVYKYTLRQVYILNSAVRWVRHHLRARLLRFGFEKARYWSSCSRPFWGDVPREIAELCLETSLCLGMIAKRRNEQGQILGVFRFTDWLCPASLNDGSEIAAVETLELIVDLKSRIAISCCVNGEELGATRNALCWVYLALSAYQHTMVHAYANWAADPQHKDRYVRRAARWTLSTNAVAIYSGNAFQRDARSFQQVARYNGAKSMFRHGNGAMMDAIAEHSQFARFVLDARVAFMEVMGRKKINVDLEALFLMTVVHSLDHHMAAVCVDPIDLVPEDTNFHPAQNVRVLFSEPLEPMGLNMRLRSFRHGWPCELYKALCLIDPDLAGCVDIGVSY